MNEQDPSMEDILQSIRSIIAEGDGEAPEKSTSGNGPSPTAADLSSDVLELTEMVQEDGSTVSLQADAPAAPVDVLANIDSVLQPPPPPAPPPPAEEKAPPPPQPAAAEEAMPMDDDSLLNQQAAAASAAALQKLNQPRSAPKPAAVSPGMDFRSGNTVEDLVMESLRPMLAEWLNANLPAIVERIVEREVKKLTG